MILPVTLHLLYVVNSGLVKGCPLLSCKIGPLVIPLVHSSIQVLQLLVTCCLSNVSFHAFSQISQFLGVSMELRWAPSLYSSG